MENKDNDVDIELYSSNDSSSILDDIDTINGIPIKNIKVEKNVVSETNETKEVDEAEVQKLITKRNKKKIWIALLAILVFILFFATYYSLSIYNRNNEFEELQELSFGQETVLSIRRIKKLKIKNFIKREKTASILYWSLKEKDLDNYFTLLKEDGFYQGGKSSKIFLLRAIPDSNEYLIVEHDKANPKSLLYQRKSVLLGDFNLDIFKEDFKDYEEKSFGSDNLGFLTLPSSFRQVDENLDSLHLSGDLIKSITLSKRSEEDLKTILDSQEDWLSSQSFKTEEVEKYDNYSLISAYNSTHRLWNKSYIFNFDDEFFLIEYLSLEKNDYIDKLITNYKLLK